MERIWFYGLEQWGLEAANAYQDAFIAHFEDLVENPELYPIIDKRRDYRRSLCGKDSVYYRVDGKTVEIMAIIGQQDAGAWL